MRAAAQTLAAEGSHATQRLSQAAPLQGRARLGTRGPERAGQGAGRRPRCRAAAGAARSPAASLGACGRPAAPALVRQRPWRPHQHSHRPPRRICRLWGRGRRALAAHWAGQRSGIRDRRCAASRARRRCLSRQRAAAAAAPPRYPETSRGAVRLGPTLWSTAGVAIGRALGRRCHAVARWADRAVDRCHPLLPYACCTGRVISREGLGGPNSND